MVSVKKRGAGKDGKAHIHIPQPSCLHAIPIKQINEPRDEGSQAD